MLKSEGFFSFLLFSYFVLLLSCFPIYLSFSIYICLSFIILSNHIVLCSVSYFVSKCLSVVDFFHSSYLYNFFQTYICCFSHLICLFSVNSHFLFIFSLLPFSFFFFFLLSVSPFSFLSLSFFFHSLLLFHSFIFTFSHSLLPSLSSGRHHITVK